MEMTHAFTAELSPAQQRVAASQIAIRELTQFSIADGVQPFVSGAADSAIAILQQIHALTVAAELVSYDKQELGEKGEYCQLNPELHRRVIASVGTLASMAAFFVQAGCADIKSE